MKKKESALFFSYLCAHILQIAFLLLCFAIFAVILYLYDLPADPVLYAALLCAAVCLLSSGGTFKLYFKLSAVS